MSAEYVCAFTRNELIVLESALRIEPPPTLSQVITIGTYSLSALVLSVGNALLSVCVEGLDTPPESADVMLSPDDLWYIWSTVDIHSRIGRDNVGEGLSLKLKVYKHLVDRHKENMSRGVSVVGMISGEGMGTG